MAKLKEYISKIFSKSFLTLFIPFYIIISLTYLLNISRLSSRISLDSQDFLTFYSYVIPDIIFITLPLTFLAAIINLFSKLSENNEAIALFSLGIRPKTLLKTIFPLSLLFTLLLLLIAIFIIPYSNQTMKNFKNKKIYESNLKILPNTLSQDFGGHHIFIEKNSNGNFKNITMFTPKEGNNFQILISESGSVVNPPQEVSYLNLNNGSIYQTQKNDYKIINYKNMKLFNNAKFYTSKVDSFFNYWLKHKQKFYYYTLLSLTPLLLFVFYFSLGIYNPRYQRNFASLYILLSVMVIYIPAVLARKYEYPFVAIAVVFAWILLSILSYYLRVAKRF